ncbi:MAG: hypothetical protein V4683_04050 [Bacteroidota bacterium]
MKKLLIIIGYIFIVSCKSEEVLENSSNDVFFSYSPTQCSEKWQFGANDTETLANIKLFLKENEIEVKTITISQPDGKIYCAACNCPSGRYIDLTADLIYLEKLKKLGYIQKIIN